jgi:outer membrane protein TolC
MLLILPFSLPLFAGMSNLSLNSAIEILKNDNLELKVSRFNEQMKAYEVKAVEGLNYGKLDLTVMGLRSNDALNVFGFTLQSREATFGDFGFSDFNPANPNILSVQPHDLNYPGSRNHFPVKLSYMIPLYTGGKLTEYKNITESLHHMSQFDTKKLLNAKIFEVKKAFYDISLVENYITNLSKIMKNINKLYSTVETMQREGYAQSVDTLEVEAHKAAVESMYNQAELNKELAYQFLSFLLNAEVNSVKRVREMAAMPNINRAELEKNNIDIQKAKLGLAISQMAVEAEKGNFRPEAGAFAEYGSADDVFLNDFLEKDAYTVGVRLKWNLFNGGVDEANLEKAKVHTMMVRDQVELAKKGVGLKVKKLRSEVLAANADVRSYSKQLNFATKVYESYQERYKEGMVSISDVIMKQSKELEVLLQLLTAKHKRNTKVFELDSVLNRGGNV